MTTANNEFVVPVVIEGAAGKNIISYEFDLRYDPTLIEPLQNPIDVKGSTSRGFFFVSNVAAADGLLKVAAYGPLPVTENGVLSVS